MCKHAKPSCKWEENKRAKDGLIKMITAADSVQNERENKVDV